MNDLVFKLATVPRLVVIEDENGKKTEYELREMKASARDTYMTQYAKRCHVTKEGHIGSLKEFDGAEAELLILSMFNKETNKPVTKELVQSWPANVVAGLYKAAFDHNAMGNKTESEKALEEKNA